MYWKFNYENSTPSYKTYEKLLNNLEKKSEKFFKLNDMFYEDYDYEKLLKYEKSKKEMVLEMFNDIIKCFPVLNNIKCAIYLNGSYARNSITANSDLDLTFYFKKDEIEKYQTLVYLIRYAISKMFNVNIVHVHSFTKNFTTEYRKDNNLVEKEQNLKTEILWTFSDNKLIIDYPDNQMIPEREICEITSIKSIEDLNQLYYDKLNELHPKEWMYTHRCIYISDDSLDINNVIRKMDSLYDKNLIEKKLLEIKDEIKEMSQEITDYYDNLNKKDLIKLADFNMIGKRTSIKLVTVFVTYLRWYYIYNGKNVLPLTLDVEKTLNYDSNLFDKDYINKIKKNYYYYKYLVSRVEMWAKKYNHHFEHRSNEVLQKEVLNKEYKDMWKVEYLPLDEQISAFKQMSNEMLNLLGTI